MWKIFFLIIIFGIFASSCTDEVQIKQLQQKEQENALLLKKNELLEQQLALEREKLKADSNVARPLTELYLENKQSVFLIFTSGEWGRAQASGFFLRSDGLAITNYHVLEDADQAIVVCEDKTKYMISEVVAKSEELDYAIFKINNTENKVFHTVDFSKESPKVGEECFAIGNPEGLELTLSKGIISGMRDYYIQTTAQITYGSSGGALFNSYGKVIGLTTSGNDAADLNFALDLTSFDIQKLCKDHLDTTVNIIGSDTLSNDLVISLIENYLEALENDDFLSLNGLFSDYLSRFYNKFDLSKSEAIKEHRKYAKIYPHPKSKIDYNSVEITQDLDQTTLVNFQMDFTIKKASWTSSERFRYDMFIGIDKDHKIKSVFTNIIK